MSKSIATLTFIALSFVSTILVPSDSCGKNDGKKMRKAESNMNKAPIEQNTRLPAGLWGAEHIRLEVSGSGATIEYDCAHGTIDQTIAPDADGNFDVHGTHMREHGGPIRVDEESRSSRARYVGRVKDEMMTLTVTLAETEENIGTFTLRRGTEVRLKKCR